MFLVSLSVALAACKTYHASQSYNTTNKPSTDILLQMHVLQ